MIFVTLGTQDKQFTRLLEALEMQLKDKKIVDEIIVQAGHTKFKSDVMTILEYIPFDKFEEYIDRADIIITHGGVGSIISSLKKQKKVIAVPRLSKYNEHTNDHQLQIIEQLSKDGYIIDGSNLDELFLSVEKTNNFEPREYISNTTTFINKLDKEINKLF